MTGASPQGVRPRSVSRKTGSKDWTQNRIGTSFLFEGRGTEGAWFRRETSRHTKRMIFFFFGGGGAWGGAVNQRDSSLGSPHSGKDNSYYGPPHQIYSARHQDMTPTPDSRQVLTFENKKTYFAADCVCALHICIRTPEFQEMLPTKTSGGHSNPKSRLPFSFPGFSSTPMPKVDHGRSWAECGFLPRPLSTSQVMLESQGKCRTPQPNRRLSQAPAISARASAGEVPRQGSCCAHNDPMGRAQNSSMVLFPFGWPDA